MGKSSKTPASVSLGELAKIAARAARKADKEARAAGIRVAGIDRANVLDKGNVPAGQRLVKTRA